MQVGLVEAQLALGRPHEQRLDGLADIAHGLRCWVGDQRRAGENAPGLIGPDEIDEGDEVAGALRRRGPGQDVAPAGQRGQVQAVRAPLTAAPALHTMGLIEDQVGAALEQPPGQGAEVVLEPLVVNEDHLGAVGDVAGEALDARWGAEAALGLDLPGLEGR